MTYNDHLKTWNLDRQMNKLLDRPVKMPTWLKIVYTIPVCLYVAYATYLLVAYEQQIDAPKFDNHFLQEEITVLTSLLDSKCGH